MSPTRADLLPGTWNGATFVLLIVVVFIALVVVPYAVARASGDDVEGEPDVATADRITIWDAMGHEFDKVFPGGDSQR